VPSPFTIRLVDHGRSGEVVFSEGDGRSHTFDWEFEAGSTAAFIRVPTPDQWPAAVPWAEGRRTEILELVAE
jgi:hypothetical protein